MFFRTRLGRRPIRRCKFLFLSLNISLSLILLDGAKYNVHLFQTTTLSFRDQSISVGVDISIELRMEGEWWDVQSEGTHACDVDRGEHEEEFVS